MNKALHILSFFFLYYSFFLASFNQHHINFQFFFKFSSSIGFHTWNSIEDEIFISLQHTLFSLWCKSNIFQYEIFEVRKILIEGKLGDSYRKIVIMIERFPIIIIQGTVWDQILYIAFDYEDSLKFCVEWNRTSKM